MKALDVKTLSEFQKECLKRSAKCLDEGDEVTAAAYWRVATIEDNQRTVELPEFLK
jgi:hypothetical protein